MKNSSKYVISALFISLLLLSGCGSSKEAAEVSAPETDITAEPAETPEPTPIPTPEPTPVPVYEILGKSYQADEEYIDLSEITPDDVPDVAELLTKFDGITEINLLREDGSCALAPAVIHPLREAAPDAVFDVRFELFGLTADNDTKELRYDKVKIGNAGIDVFRDALPYLRSLELLRLKNCGVDNEPMDALRSDFPDVNIVWSILFGSYPFMSDTTRMNTTLLNDSNVYLMKYFKDVLYLDTGHNQSITNIDFVKYFPKLQVCIVAITKTEDLTPLQNCPDLEYLEVFSSRVKDLSPLATLTKLEHLNIANLPDLQDISPLYGLTSLKRLRLDSKNRVPQEQRDKIKELIPDCDFQFGGGGPSADGWRFEADGKTPVERYALLREQMDYKNTWQKRQTNSPSELTPSK